MALKVSKAGVWSALIEDRPGALAEKLSALAGAGANLAFVLARRAPEKPGTGVAFVTPLKGAKQLRAAKAAGFARTSELACVRVEGPDKAGQGAKLTAALAARGINLRGLSATAIGRRFVAFIAVDSARDASRAARILRAL